MSVTQLPSGRWRAQVHDPRTGRNISAAKILGGPASYPTKRAAKTAREDARKLLARNDATGTTITVAQFRYRWLTDPLFKRPKESTRLHYRERTGSFADRYGSLPIAAVDDAIVTEWLALGHASTVPALRVMFNDAATVKAGRLVAANPFARLGLARSRGNAETDPPPETTVWELIAAARKLAGPYMAAWLQVAAFTGMRPGELDALKWEDVDLQAARIHVARQWSIKARRMTRPKNGRARDAILTPPAREALAALPRDPSGWCFVNTRGGHWTHHARVHHWDRIREHVGYTGTLYLATRHFAGHFMVNVLGLDSEDVAFALGHEDGGELVRRLYGHRDRRLALDRVQRAFESTGNVKPLRAVKEAG